MHIRRCPIMFNNVISAKVTSPTDQWHEGVKGIRNAIIRNGLYGTGPVMYQIGNVDEQTNEAEYTFFIPVSEPIEMKENDEYSFEEKWLVQDALVYRHADLDEDIEDSYALLRACAEANELTLQEPFYNIYLDVFGGGLIDICAPILKEG
ncbi:DUF5085 family protein [Paenibacillus sp. L3-i20]|uniref:DUF5085 family protein n=1 Tax=Paenibacillus sp. L3-i20 TaxID=2905833 RepID=UPI001EDEF23E|nr:DUF5085 family protein [Paenibacillus sp. L3-i20]GKU77590.1 hypothetical protein L3i20_v219870 [Paenibacillus sp. L3-i20]